MSSQPYNVRLANQAFIPTRFDILIDRFNHMYALPHYDVGTTRSAVLDRLKKFKDILAEEMTELDTIITNVDKGVYVDFDSFRTDLADFLGDVQVYCASEMDRFNMRNSAILDIIMESNFSKLGLDGLPIHDERGKVLKGPNYWKPEPTIHAYLIR
jgi:hypothetical protein